MIYDGVVIKTNKKKKDEFYLFLVDPILEQLQDGINISEHSCYDDMKYDQIMTVNVTLKDGTVELDDIDLDEFIHGDKYGKHDVFLYIQDLLLFDIGHEEKSLYMFGDNLTVEDIVKRGDLNDLALNLINKTTEEMEKKRRKK